MAESISDTRYRELLAAGFGPGSLNDMERRRLLAKLGLPASANLSLSDLYRAAGEIRWPYSGFAPVVTEFNPETLSNLSLWLKADALALANDATVVTWDDSSAANNDATAVNTPKFKTNAINGKPAVEFGIVASVDARFTSPASTSGAEQTIFAVVNVDSFGIVRAIRGSSAPGGLCARVETSGVPGLLKQATAGIGNGTSPLTAATWALLTFTHSDSGNTYSHRLNGAPNGSGASAQSMTGGLSTLIGWGDGVSEGFVGRIAELICYNALRTGPEIDTVEDYLQAKYGL